MADQEYLKQLISAYLDGETTPEENRLVEEHLAKDASLKKYFQDLQDLSSTLKSWNEEDPSPDLEQKMNRALQQAPVKEGKPMNNKVSSPMKIAATLAMALIVTSVSLKVYFERTIQSRIKEATDASNYSAGMTAQPLSKPVTVATTQSNRQSQSVTIPTERKAEESSALAKVADKQVLFGSAASHTLVETQQYEPYYLETDYNVVADGLKAPVSGTVHEMAMSASSIYPVPYQQDWNTEQYNRIYDNAFLEVAQNPLSTFSIDVDTASYSNLRRFLNNDQMPPEDSVRIEEMINYFSYDYPEPKAEHPFSVTTEVATCPWNPDHQIALIGLQGKRLQTAEMPPSNLVFLIDVSGSMDESNKLPLLQSALKMMVQQLRAEDKISIVVYAGAAGEVLESTPGDQKQKILNAIERLSAGGSTAGGAGIQLAYETAKKNFVKDGNNRVVLATDGDFNIGVSSDGELVRIIEEKRKDGIFLTVLGFGTGNYKDAKMEQLADKGNGNYYYIDTIKEAKKVLVQELGSTLFTIAKDVKLQIEFNPGQVKAYRLIGYENRVLAKEDFNDDTKDAGELGTGHSVTALYELVPVDSEENFAQVDDLKYQATQIKPSDDLLTVKLRYKKPDEEISKLLSQVVKKTEVTTQPGNNLNWASSVAEFGLVLRNSEHKGKSTYGDALLRATASRGDDPWGFRQELIDLIKKAESLDTRNLVPGGGIGTK